MRGLLWASLLVSATACGAGTAYDGDDPIEVGEPCAEDQECLSGTCMPFGQGSVCASACAPGDDCGVGLSCLDLGSVGMWCLPQGGCVPDCAGRCCGDDGCGGECADVCPSTCSASTCSCDAECTPDAIQPCSAHGSCSGTEQCRADGVWSTCDSPDWSCTEPGLAESCTSGACPGTRQCQTDCAWGQCQADCAGDTTCCGADGCVELATDLGNCGDCGRVCHFPDTEVDTCHSGACCFKSARNGHQEACDDARFDVPSPYVPMYLVCRTGAGGVAFITSDTGPPCVADNIRRCQCWEDYGQDPVAELPNHYIAHMTCTYDGQHILVDLSAWAGQSLWVGAHDQPDGSGDMTDACIASGI